MFQINPGDHDDDLRPQCIMGYIACDQAHTELRSEKSSPRSFTYSCIQLQSKQ